MKTKPVHIISLTITVILANIFLVQQPMAQSTIKAMLTPPIVEKDRAPVQFFHDYPAVLADFSVVPGQGAAEISWQTLYEENMKKFMIQYSEDGISWQPAGETPALNNPAGSKYNFRHTLTNPDRMVFYRLQAVNHDGRVALSPEKKLVIAGQAGNYIFPSIISQQRVNLYLNESFESIQVINMDGNIILRQPISGKTGRIGISLPTTATGAYVVRVQNKDPRKTIVKRVIVE